MEYSENPKNRKENARSIKDTRSRSKGFQGSRRGRECWAPGQLSEDLSFLVFGCVPRLAR